jgi:hypothetical protein
MQEPFEPRNELERQLLAAQEGRLPEADFVAELTRAQLFMPVLDDSGGIANFQRSNKLTPLTIEAEDGSRALVIFTSPDRAKPFVKDFPGYGGGILTDLKWIAENMGIGFGIVLNPGCEVGLELEAGDVQQMAGLQ